MTVPWYLDNNQPLSSFFFRQPKSWEIHPVAQPQIAALAKMKQSSAGSSADCPRSLGSIPQWLLLMIWHHLGVRSLVVNFERMDQIGNHPLEVVETNKH